MLPKFESELIKIPLLLISFLVVDQGQRKSEYKAETCKDHEYHIYYDAHFWV
jgi:hypothetical protein